MMTTKNPHRRLTAASRSRFAALGLLLAGAALCSPVWAKEHEDDDEHEEEVAWAQVPAAVQATMEREAHGGRILEVEKEREHGRSVYEAEVRMADGSTREICVAPDGTWLKSEPEDADDHEEHEGREDHEMGEHHAHMN